MSGPLKGLTVVELAGIGPAPHCCMMLSDMGASVIRVEPPGGRSGLNGQKFAVLNRGRKSIIVDLKRREGVEVVLKLCESADGFVEGFRPGVTERLGLGPDVVAARNPRIVYGRMTGWGQTGPLAKVAGHDINYISIAGALHAVGRRGTKPTPPLNLVGDFGGGSMLLAFGMVSGMLQARMTGKGNVVDAAMVDGVGALLGSTYGLMAQGRWDDGKREANLVDGGAHFYDTYECKDGRYVSIGPIEPQFYTLLVKLAKLEGSPVDLGRGYMPKDKWPAAKRHLEAVFLAKTREEWCEIMEYTDVCFAPVLTMSEAHDHPHAKARGAFIEIEGVRQPAPAPRFSHTPPGLPHAPPEVGGDTAVVLRAAGLDVEALVAGGVVQDRSASLSKL